MALDDKDILQMDATIIAGALVLLTVSSIAPSAPALTSNLLIVLAGIIIIFFGGSAFSILWKNGKKGSVIWGFSILVILMFSVVVIIVVQIFFSDILPLFKSDDSGDISGSNQSNNSMGSKDAPKFSQNQSN